MNSEHEQIVKFKKNSVVFAEGEASSYLYIIKSGKIRIVKEDGKRLIPISTLGKQEFIQNKTKNYLLIIRLMLV